MINRRLFAASFALLFAGLLCLLQAQAQMGPLTGANTPFTKTSRGGWSPLTVSAAFWYDASDASTTHNTAGTITTWDDKSGNGRHLTQAGSGGQVATLVSNVKNSMPGVLFSASGNDGAILATTSTFSVSSPNTVVLALYGDVGWTAPAFPTVWMVASTADQAILLDSQKAALYAGGAVVDISASAIGVPMAVTIYGQFNGSTSRGGVNGVDIGSNVNPGTGTITSANIQFGRTGNSDLVLMDAYILESFGFAGVNGTDLSNSLSYLNTKWGGFP